MVFLIDFCLSDLSTDVSRLLLLYYCRVSAIVSANIGLMDPGAPVLGIYVLTSVTFSCWTDPFLTR